MNRLARSFALLLSFAGLLLGTTDANALVCVSQASGNWNAGATTWAPGCGAAGPVAGDTVTVLTGHTVTVTANAACATLTVNAGGIVNVSTFRLRPTGLTTINGTINFTGISTSRFGGGVLLNTGGVWANTGNSPITFRGVGGGITNNGGTFTSGTGIYTFDTNPQTIAGTSPVTISNVTVTAIALTNNGTLTVPTALSGTGSLVNSATGTLNLGGTSAITTLNAATAGNTVNYTGAAAQTAKVTTYSNLTLSGSGAKTFATTPTVNGVLSLEGTATVVVTAGVVTYGPAATLQYNKPAAYTATLEEWPATFNATGGVIIKNTGVITTGAAKVLSSGVPLTIDLGASLTTVANTLDVGGDLTVNGTLTGSSGAITLSGAAPRTIDGTGSIIATTTGTLLITTSRTILNTANLTIARPTTLSAATTVTNNGIINKTTTAALNGANATTSIWVNAANSTLNYAGTNAPMATGVLDVSATGNTVDYNGAGQTVKPPGGATPAYYHLTLSGSAAKIMGATTINGNFTMSGAATTAPTGALAVGGNFTVGTGTTFTAGAFNHTVSGNFDATGTFTSTGTVTLNGAAAQTISGADPVAFNTLNVTNGASPNITLATNVTATTLTGTATLTSTCPIDYTLTSTTPAQVLHSCPPVTPPANFDCVETGVTYTPNPVFPARNPLYTKLAGTALSFDVVALKADGTVETTYASASDKSVTVELVDGTGATACASRTALTPAVSQTLTFTAADLGRKTTASMTVSKAYANLRCRVTDATATPIVGCSVDNFSVRPFSLALTATGLGADATGASTTATPVVKAGANFTLTATASDTGYTGTPTIDPAALAAHSGAVLAGTLTGTFAAAVSGVVSSTFTYDEVGYFMLNANGLLDTTFTAADNAVGDCTADFSTTPDVNGKYGCKVGSAAAGYFGRFIPDHFVLTTGSFIDRTDINTGASETCSSPFTYMGEDFKTMFTLVAKNSTPATTQNYTGGHAKFDLATWSNFTFTGSGGTLVQGSLAPSGAWGSTAGTYGTADVTATHTVTRAAAPVAPYTSFSVSAQPSYTDGAATIALAASTVVHAGTSEQRFGRLKLSNAHGSERLNLPVPIEAQYWNGSAFIRNTADGCTTLAANNIKLATPPAGVNAVMGGAFSSGAGSLTLTKPATPAKVAVDLCVDLDSSGSGDTTCQGLAPFAVIPYLQTGVTYNKDPTARATFGVYKGDDEFIYLREAY